MTAEPDQERVTDDRAALRRLRDRTDELELIISSLTIFALFSLPGWLFGSFAAVYTHLSTALAIAATLGIALITGVSYGLAVCFVVHLMARAYWVGLIGLRTVFPDGINWEKTPGIGPIAKHHYRANLPDLDAVIKSTDRLASSLFAVISLLTLSFLWLGSIILVTLVISGQIGVRFGLTNAAMGIGTLLLLAVFAGIPALLWLLDAQLARRIPRLQNVRPFAALVRLLRWISGVIFPQRLILPVQLTLQSNTRPFVFLIALFVSVSAIVVIGNTRFVAWQNFTLSGEFSYLDAGQRTEGFRSTYYEDMQSPKDRLRGWPRLDSFHQGGGFARLFLPYQPLRDNLILDRYCKVPSDDPARIDCLRDLWSVSINGRAVPMSTFATAERMDLNMLGLIGLVPLDGLAPGMQHIDIVWNPAGNDDDPLPDDRYANVNTEYRIPFAFSPDYERPLSSVSSE